MSIINRAVIGKTRKEVSGQNDRKKSDSEADTKTICKNAQKKRLQIVKHRENDKGVLHFRYNAL